MFSLLKSQNCHRIIKYNPIDKLCYLLFIGITKNTINVSCKTTSNICKYEFEVSSVAIISKNNVTINFTI